MADLFEKPKEKYKVSEHAPLADRMRPQKLEEFVGQKQLLSPGQPLYEAIVNDKMSAAIFWGPPGSGKTYFVQRLAASLPGDVRYRELNLAGCSQRDFLAALQELQRETAPCLCLIDEVDAKQGAAWP